MLISILYHEHRLNTLEGDMKKMRYRVYRFDIKMTRDQGRLEQFLNSLKGEVVTIIPNVTPHALHVRGLLAHRRENR